jgi:2-polyprenyl-6-methoxyphenol hydroxylase-like FAD-dependent oxidoreductase
MNTSDSAAEKVTATCCVAGGGPAGMMLGFLLARAGVDVIVLEKHKDFFRDFRGDTIHPSTLELMHELGFLDEFLALPHQEVHEIRAHFGDQVVPIADFSHLPTRCKFIALLPQWDFLNFLAEKAGHYSAFRLRMEAEVCDLLTEGERVVGVRVRTPQGDLEVRSALVIDLGAPIDVLWFRLPKHPGDPEFSLGHVGAGQFMVLIDRDDYWQSAYVIRKGSFDDRRARGLEAFREEVARCTPFLRDRVGQLTTWDDVKLLTVKVDHLRQWYRDGLLCIGDSAHAMSPVGGVGINLAIQDSVATANLLAAKLRSGTVTVADLRAVQRRRERPAQLTQRAQVFLHEHFLERIFESTEPMDPPWPARLLALLPPLRRLPARMVGLGFRPEHVT